MIVVAGPRASGKSSFVASWLAEHPTRRVVVDSRHAADYWRYLGLENRVVDVNQDFFSRNEQYAFDNFNRIAYTGVLANIPIAPSLITVDASEVIRLFPRHIHGGVKIHDCKI